MEKKDGVTGSLYEIAIDHQYYVRGGFFTDGKNNRHACLQEGWWCWQNARQHPQDIIKYLKKILANTNKI
jgi:hypothetical protein